MSKDIAEVWEFASSSGSNRYQTRLYTDGTTSCNCKGWTILRDKAGGVRTCKHTTMVDMGSATQQALSHIDYTQTKVRKTTEKADLSSTAVKTKKDKEKPVKATDMTVVGVRRVLLNRLED